MPLPLTGHLPLRKTFLVGWSANLGTTYTAAVADAGSSSYLLGLSAPAFFGTSSVGDLQGSSALVGVEEFGASAGQINDTSGGGDPMLLEPLLAATPEPGTLALAALGGASLLLFRRKK